LFYKVLISNLDLQLIIIHQKFGLDKKGKMGAVQNSN